MNREEILDIIIREKLVAVVRLERQDQIPQVIKALVAGDIKVLEVTSNTPGYLEEIKIARSLYPDILIGTGTVTSTEIAERAIAAGAQFLITPNTDAGIVALGHSSNIPILMGAMTPTEINVAVKAGADAIKLFPAGSMGTDYFKAIKGPFDKVKFFAVGGIGLKDVKLWMKAGALGLGIGGNLTKPIRNKQDFKNVVAMAKQFKALIN